VDSSIPFTALLTDSLVIVAFALLLLVTGGIGYLTWVDWADRRRLQQDQRDVRRGGRR
jgi:hypothetical protein